MWWSMAPSRRKMNVFVAALLAMMNRLDANPVIP